MTDTITEHADPELHKGEALVEMEDVGKAYGAIRALRGVNLKVRAGEVTCVLGDNGAGKSTLIKIIAGLHPHNEGTLKVDGQQVAFSSPRDALTHGIATVYQDLAVVGLMEVWRNFFLGSEMTSSRFPFAPLRVKEMKRIAEEGRGVLLYLNQEGRGIGLTNKIRAYELQDQGLDTVEANERLGFKADQRDYGIGVQILKDLGVRSMRLLSNNPRKLVGIEGYQLSVAEWLPLEIPASDHTRSYLKTKKEKLGHKLTTV